MSETEKTDTPLNLPPTEIPTRIDKSGTEQIYDRLRHRWMVTTPEETVRQHFVAYLIEHREFPPSRIANEVGLSLNGTRRRCDTVVYDNSLRPLCIVEYKRTTVRVTAAVFDQIARYNSVLGAPFLIVSNGLRHYCCRFTGDGYTFLRDIPTFAEMLTATALRLKRKYPE